MTGGALRPRAVWVPDEVVTASGIEFVKLSKKERGFAAFVGVPDAHDKKDIWPLKHCTWLAEIQVMRNREVRNWFNEQGASPLLAGADSNSDSPLAPYKKSRTSPPDAPAYVTVGLPRDGGRATLNMRVLFQVCDRACVHVELTPENLDYARVAMIASWNHGDDDGNSGTPEHDNPRVRWRKATGIVPGMWLVKYWNPKKGKMSCKFFRPTSTCEAAVVAAGEHADEFANENITGDADVGGDGSADGD